MKSSEAHSPNNPYAVLAIRDFACFLGGFLLSVVGWQMFDVAVGWELYERTQSATMLGLVGLAEGLPVLLFSLFAGHVADRYSRRKVLLGSLLVSAFCSAALAAISRHQGSLWSVYALLFVTGSARAFRSPSASALVTQIVPDHLLANAVAWRSSTFEVASVTGPMVGGFLIAWFHNYALVYLLNALCCVVFLLAVLSLREQPLAKSKEKLTRTRLLAGIKYIRQTPVILSMITLDLFAVLLGGATALLPIFAKDILHTDARGLGWLRAAPAIGACTMALIQAHLPPRFSPLKNAGRALLLAVTGFGLSTIIFGLSTSFWLSMAMLFMTGVFDNISVVIRMTGTMLLTPDHMRGRVAAVNYIFIGASNEFGAFESGITAAAWGPVASVVAGGFGTIAAVFCIMWLWPELRKLKELHSDA